MKKVLYLISVFAAVFMAASCKVGLGHAVDVLSPSISISSPESNAIIRDKFGIYGEWSDDGSIKSIEVSFKGISDKSKTVAPVTATFNADSVETDTTSGTWFVEIDPFKTSTFMPDGTYEATIVIKDNGGHKTEIARSYTIDNTPPVVVLQRPGTKGEVTVDEADPYGKTFSLEGQSADDNNISRINVYIYSDAAHQNFIDKVELNNVPPTIQLDVAKYGDEHYKKLYDDTTESGTKQYFCTIEAFDDAQRYPMTSADQNQSSEDTLGNKTESYYLYDDISEVLSDYKVTEIYKMMNGSYKPSSNSPDKSASGSADDIIATVKGLLEGKSQSQGSFSLNPKNNPTYVVNGLSSLPEFNVDLANGDYSITNNVKNPNTKIIEVSPGLDNISLKIDSIKVYVIECDTDGTEIENAKKIYPKVVSAKKSGGSNYQVEVQLSNLTKGLSIGHTYLFGVEGADIKGNTILPATTGFGFYLASSGEVPGLTVTEPASANLYVDEKGSVTIKGTTTVETGAPVITILSDGDDEPWATIELNEADAENLETKYKYYFETTISNETLVKKSKKNGVPETTAFQLKIQSTLDGKTAEYPKTVFFDVEKPTINITGDQISPAIEAYAGAENADENGVNKDGYVYTNGVVTVSGNITDDLSFAKYSWRILKNNVAIENLGGASTSPKININFDTCAIDNADKNQLTLLIEALDTAGNVEIKNLPFFVDQSTDRPTFGALDGTSWDTSVKNPNYINKHSLDADDSELTNLLSGDLNSKLVDDDGVAFVIFELKAVDIKADVSADDKTAVGYVINQAKTDNNLKDTEKCYGSKKTGKDTSVTFRMPSKAGYYEVTQTVYDSNYVVAGTESVADYKAAETNEYNKNYFRKEVFVVKLQGKGPQFITSQETSYVSTLDQTKEISVDITIEDGEGPYSIVRKLAGISGEVTVTSNLQDAADGELTKYKDTFCIKDVDFSGKEDITYTITDSNGTTSRTVNYIVDNDAPNQLTIENPKTDTSATGESALSGTEAAIRGVAKDASSGMDYILYAFTDKSVVAEPEYTKYEVGDGTWTIYPELASGKGAISATKLYEGSYKLWVKAVDKAGNITTTPVVRVFDVDQNSPVINSLKLKYEETETALTAGTTKFFKSLDNTKQFKITGQIEESNGIKELKVCGETVTLASPENYTYSFTYSIDYKADEKITIPVQITDSVGRVTTANYDIYCDTQAPVLEITNPNADEILTGKNALSKSKETFRANVNDAEGSGVVSYKYLFTQTQIGTNTAAEIIASAEAAGNNWTVVSGNNIAEERELVAAITRSGTIQTQLTEGSWIFYVYAKDSLGNTSVKFKDFWIDLAEPELTFEEIETPRNDAVVLKGTASDGNGIKAVSVKVDGNVIAENIYTDFVGEGYTLTVGAAGVLPDGEHTVIVTVQDGSEKTSEAKQKFVVDTVAPTGGILDTVTSSQATKVIDGKKWYSSSSYNLKVRDSSITESGSGIDSVESVIIEDYRASSVDLVSSAFLSAQSLKKTNTESDKLYRWTGRQEIEGQGPNKVMLKVTDKAGNVLGPQVLDTIYLDSLAPVITGVYEAATAEEIAAATTGGVCSLTNVGSAEKPFYVKEVSAKRFVNGTEAFVVFVAVADENPGTVHAGYAETDYYSGLASVTYQSGNLTPVTADADNSVTVDGVQVPVAAGFTKITIPANTATVKQQNGAAKFAATDNVGNKSSTLTAFTFEVDGDAPVITLGTVSDADDSTTKIDVNKNLTITGNISDASSLASVTLKYKVTATTATPSTWDSESLGTGTSINKTINTVTLADKNYLHYFVEAVDVAGNKGETTVKTVYINQDSDRPIISFSNLDLSETNKLSGSNTINGVITDDDGTIGTGVLSGTTPSNGFCYKDGAAGVWKSVTVTSGGSWKIQEAAGEHEFYFWIKDSNGTVFQTSTAASITEAINLTQPKLKSEKENTATWIAVNTESAKVSFKIDLQDPEITLDPITTPRKGAVVLKGTATDDYDVETVTVMVGDKVLASDGTLKTPATGVTEKNIYTDYIGTGYTLTVGTDGVLPEGSNVIKVTVTDKAGKTKPAQQTVVVDTIAPKDGEIDSTNSTQATYTNGTKKWYNNATFNLKIKDSTITEAGSGIEGVEAVIIEAESTLIDSRFLTGTSLKKTKPDSDNVDKWNGKLEIPGQGPNKVYIKVTDYADNSYTSEALGTVYLDTLAPNPETIQVYEKQGDNLVEITGTRYVNGQSDLVVYVKAQDSAGTPSTIPTGFTAADYNSGIKTIVYQCGNNTVSPDADQTGVPSGYFKITIPANTDSVTYQNGAAKFIATDNVNNSCSATTVFNFSVDDVPPAISLVEIEDADNDAADVDVNKTITIAGTVTDENALSSVKLYYQVTSEANAANVAWTGEGVSVTEVDLGTTKTVSYNLDTTALADNNFLYYYISAADTAGNPGESDKVKLHINQYTDRPVIEISNLDLTEADDVWLKGTSNLTGVITDDDGKIKTGVVGDDGTPTEGFCYKDGADGEWKSVTVNGVSWTIRVDEEGSHEFYFYVNDGKNEFTTDPSETDKLVQPAIKAYDATNLVFHKDTETPKPVTSSIRYQTSASSDWKTGTDVVYYGGVYNKFFFKLKAWDANGVDSVKLLFNGTDEYDGKIELGADEERTEATEEAAKLAGNSEAAAKYWIFNDIEIDDELNGNVQFKITITDKANQIYEDILSITVDNTAPVISFTNHNDGDEVYASSTVQINGASTSNDIKEWYYLLNETASGVTASTSGFTSMTPGTSFSIVYGAAASANDGKIYLQKLYNEIKRIENINADTALDDDVRDMYLWVYGKDTSGNTSDMTSLHLCVIPNGDKPKVNVTYPLIEEGKETTLGGLVRVTGGTEIMDSTVQAVYVQIDPTPDVSYVADTNGKYFQVSSNYVYDDGKRYKPATEVDADTVDISAESVDTNKAVVFTENESGEWLKYGDVYRKVSALTYYKKVVEFTDNWETHLKAKLPSGKQITEYYSAYTTNSGCDGILAKAVKAAGTSASWNITLNSKNEFDTNGNTTDHVALRIFAKSATGKVSTPVDIWYVNDVNSPQISNLKLEHYAQGASTPDVIQAYDADMWLNCQSGQWYLTGDVKDNSGIKRIEFTNSSNNTVELVSINEGSEDVGSITSSDAYKNYLSTDGAATASGNFNYKLKIPVGNYTEDTWGSLSYSVVAYEGTVTNLYTKQTVTLRYDNKSPEFAYKNSEGVTYTTAGTATTPVDMELKNGTFSMKGTVIEASDETNGSQSGFSRVAVYFTRTKNSTVNVIDPMQSNLDSDASNNGYANYIASASTASATAPALDSKDKLYWYKFKGNITNNLITISTTDFPYAIRDGGLVKINGTYYPIYNQEGGSAVVYNTAKSQIEISVNGTLENATNADIYFAVAQIIDHKTAEGSASTSVTGTFDFDNPLDSDVNDDGDQMIESVDTQGVTTTWSAGIDSSLIMDGSITIHFVAFDEAGNTNYSSYSGNVKNNAPRLYGFKYATDRNSNGKIDDDEWIDDYSQKFSVLDIGADETEGTSDDVTLYGYEKSGANRNKKVRQVITDRLTVKGLTKMVPQIVGGNKGLAYTVGYQDDATAEADTRIKDITNTTSNELDNTHSTGVRRGEDDDVPYEITLGAGDFLEASGLTGNKYISYKVWDYTDDLKPGSTSYYANILLPVSMKIAASSTPTAVFDPLYWTDKDHNSLYNNSSVNGHIDLENTVTPKTFLWSEVKAETGATNNYYTDADCTTKANAATADTTRVYYKGTLYDGDAKVSGTITLDGTATDDVSVQRITAKLPGLLNSETTIAERTADGTWTSVNKVTATTAAVSGWAFQLVSDEFDAATGQNTVVFKLHFNTASIANVAATDVGMEIKAYNRGTASGVISDEESTWGAVKSTANAATTWFTDITCKVAPITVVAEGVTVTDDAAKVYKPKTWSVAKTDTANLWFTDAACTTLATNATSDDTIVYKVAYTPNGSTVGTTTTTAEIKTGYYKVDIVPYVTELVTNLSSLESSSTQWAKTAYSRTALGYYPVAVNENIEIKGFNLGNTTKNPTVKLGNTTLSRASGAAAYTVGSIKSVAVGDNTSGTVIVTVNGVSNLNGYNSNAAGYNVINNGVNNATLNDDVNVKVWEFKTIATPKVAEYITYPTVKMNPATGYIGASFANDFYFNMAGFRENNERNSTDLANSLKGANWYSQTPFMKGYEGADQNTFAYDKNGYTYGAVQWKNREKAAMGGYFNFYFARAKDQGNMSTSNAYLCNSGSSRLEANCLNLNVAADAAGNHDTGSWKTNNMRIKSPVIVPVVIQNTQSSNAVDSSRVTVHIAYYDSSTRQIRYRKGVVDARGVDVNSDTAYSNNKSAAASSMNLGTNDSLRDVFDYVEGNTSTVYTGGSNRGTGGRNYPYKDSSTTSEGNYDARTKANNGQRDMMPADSLQTQSGQIIHVLASNGVEDSNAQDIYKKSHYTYGAGQYVSMVVLNTDTAAETDDVVVIAWYDSEAGKLYLSHTTDSDFDGKKNPIVATTNQHTVTLQNSYDRTAVWERKTIDLGTGGEYVQMVADSDNNIHIAYYDNGRIRYKKLSSAFATLEDVIVDSYNVDSKLTLNVGKDANNHQVPYISYYSKNHAKVAYRVNYAEGVDSATGAVDNIFTHNWEVSYVPTASSINTNDTNRINVAVWTNTSGQLKKSPVSPNNNGTTYRNDTYGAENGYSDTQASRVFANGTNNPIVAYISSSGSLDYGQIKGDSTEITFN